MVFKLLLLLIQSTNQRSEKVGFFVLEKRRNQFLRVFKQREGGVKKDERSRAKTTGFFSASKRKRDDEGVVVVVLF